jgi:hypothetical protein
LEAVFSKYTLRPLGVKVLWTIEMEKKMRAMIKIIEVMKYQFVES